MVPRNLLAGRSWVQVPAIATSSCILSFFSRYRCCQWIALTTCVHSGKEVADTLPAIKYQSVPHKDGDGRPRGEEPCDVTTVQTFRQDARRGKAPFELWKRYSSSCRYNERQLIDVTVVRGVGGGSSGRSRYGVSFALTSFSVVYLQQQKRAETFFHGPFFILGSPPAPGMPPLNPIFHCRTYPCILKPTPLFLFLFCFFLLVCCQQSTFRHEALGTHTPHASYDCHALRYHSGAHGGSVPMPPSALSAESCVVCHFG